jgi:hypothetical protein
MSRIEVRWSNGGGVGTAGREAGVSGKKFLLFCPFRHVSMMSLTTERWLLRPVFDLRSEENHRFPSGSLVGRLWCWRHIPMLCIIIGR